MANLGGLTALQADIDTNIDTNGTGAITGPVLNSVLTNIVDTLTGEPVVSAGIKVWEGFITQPGDSSAPTVSALTNTLGGTPVMSYDSPGVYRATLVGAFTPSKCSFYMGPVAAGQSAGGLYSDGFIMCITPDSSDVLLITCGAIGGTQLDAGISSAYFKIIVHP